MTRLVRTPFLVFSACMIFAGTLSASEQAGSPQPEARALTVQEAVRLTLSHSPEVLVAEAQAARAREALRESRSVESATVLYRNRPGLQQWIPPEHRRRRALDFPGFCEQAHFQQNKRQPDPRGGRVRKKPGQLGSRNGPQ